MWHDHSTRHYAIWVIYDPAIFLTAQGHAAKSGKSVQNIQEVIEQPVIYMMAPSSSSPVDQLAECLQDYQKVYSYYQWPTI